jgi:WD40 repeat protein
VWSCKTDDKKSKLEVQALSGPVEDVAWDGESKKVAVAGDGGGSFHVKVLTYDTGNSVSECVGLTKKATTLDYRPCRPFRVVAGGEDMKCVLYAGPPFKRECDDASHSNYINCVRYSPDGNSVVSVGSDKKLVLYDGKTMAKTKEVSGERASERGESRRRF